ncbi:MAG: hypothetical protein JKX70_11865 [Phycisphaerales bacterium]|nr:hypothetical protein [Phycisphaerales bacterium]
MNQRFTSHALIFSLALLLMLILTGCGLSPVYTVRVENQSSKTVLARLERRPSMNNMIVMESARLKSESEIVLGPHEARPLERVYIVIQGVDSVHDLPESNKLQRGDWVVTISDGSISSWGAYEITVRRE